MKGPTFDITLLTDHRYVERQPGDWYIENIFQEDDLLRAALEALGLRVHRTHWDDPTMDWSTTRAAVFRTTWDYFDRFSEFAPWLERVGALTQFINPLPMIRWNMDKHYLADLEKAGIPIPATAFIPRGDAHTLAAWMTRQGWNEAVLKPAVGGAARHTYRIDLHNLAAHEDIFSSLIAQEAMLLQAFQQSILERGEVTLVLMDGRYSHALQKKAKQGDFRVQDDFGGTVHPFQPDTALIAFAEKAIQALADLPAYGRVDIIWDEAGQPCVSELELIEPELWLRLRPEAAADMAEALQRRLA